jgi:biopolymer transport protein ExbB/TolQ
MFVTALFLLAAAGLVTALFDLSKMSAQALARRRFRRVSRHGWDWPAFEQEVARYTRTINGRRPAAPPR